jgi:predicted nucleic acid-binding protein
MFILDTDHISLFQRRDPHVTARVLATPALELATTVITVEEQLRGRLDGVRRARSDARWSEPITICLPPSSIFAPLRSSTLMSRLRRFLLACVPRECVLARWIYGLQPLPSVEMRPS